MGKSRTRLFVVLGIVVVVLIAAGVGSWLAFGRGGDEEPQLTHRDYAALFGSAVIRQTKISFIKQWPKPYQIYHDSYQHDCYEWYDKPIALYSLCFKNGLLVNKDLL